MVQVELYEATGSMAALHTRYLHRWSAHTTKVITNHD